MKSEMTKDSSLFETNSGRVFKIRAVGNTANGFVGRVVTGNGLTVAETVQTYPFIGPAWLAAEALARKFD